MTQPSENPPPPDPSQPGESAIRLRPPGTDAGDTFDGTSGYTAIFDAALAQAKPPPELADHPRYDIRGLLATGGMGAVFLARHKVLERDVVIKVIRPDLLHKPVQVERFRREARNSARLSHPNIVTIHEAEEVNGLHLLVMEYVPGIDLGRLARQHPHGLPVGEACEYIRQAAVGLQHIHEKGLVHRDIKPSNLMLTPQGRIKILDLGLAMLRDTERPTTQLTEVGQLVGTLDYTAPEQWEDSRTVDIRADLYSLGCTLYHLLAGAPPFVDADQGSVIKQMYAHCSKPVPPLNMRRAGLPRGLVAIVHQLLAKRREDRYGTPAEVAAALAPFAEARGMTVPDFVDPEIKRRPTRRRLLAFGMVAGLGAAAAAGFFGQRLWFGKQPAGGGPAAPTFSGPPLKIGVLHSLTGTMAVSERSVVDAVLLAVEEINASGGVLGRRVEAIIEDGESDDATFARKAGKLITEDRVAVVFGCWTSASRKSVRGIFEKHQHLLFYPVQYEGLEQSPHIVYTGAAPNQQILPGLKWSCTFLGKKRLFLVGSDYVFPRAAGAIIKDQARELGAEVVGEEYLLLGSGDVSGIIQKIKAAQPDLILNSINGDTNTAFFRALRMAGVSAEAVPTLSFSVGDEELSSLNPRDVAGDYAAWNYFEALDIPANTAFLARFRAKFGPDRRVTDPMASAYTGVHLWAKAAAAAQSTEPAAVLPALRGLSFAGPAGLTTVDPRTLHTSKHILIGRLNAQGRFDVVFRSETPIEAMPFPTSRTPAQWQDFLNDLQLRWGGQWANPGR